MSNIYVDNIYEKTTGNGIRFQDDTIRSGQIIHTGSYYSGRGPSAQLVTSSTSWVTQNIGGSAKRGRDTSESGNVITFEKRHNNSVIEIEYNTPYYFPGTANDSGFGIRGRIYETGSSTVHYLDGSTAGIADGWGAGGYGADNQAGIVNWIFSTFTEASMHNDLVDYVGNVNVYFETRLWSGSNTLYLGDYSGYNKDQCFYFREIAL